MKRTFLLLWPSPIMLTDAKSVMATDTTADVFQSNDVIHIIDTVLMSS
jgi:uncharacterized surface protein with fasciclin (FAS1) repeats